ncbi:MAG TPA: hypothetical protein VIB00_09105, partial [Pyrinomonadaceae bacterium]
MKKPAASKGKTSKSTTKAATLDNVEINRFLALKHPDPHRILGPHLVDGKIVIRVFRPDAEKVELILLKKEAPPFEKIDAAGLFEIQLSGTRIPSYRLKVNYPASQTFTLRDPYSFPSTVGELDLHLFAEGRHEEIYEKLGSHVRKIGRITGVSFAVWAPQADSVSVVGDFNGWDGRLHQMRNLYGSGVWEIFIPDLGPGALYKYEIRSRGWLPFLKTDPYAQYTEAPPGTSSIVYDSSFKFRDSKWIKARATREHYRSPLSIYELHLGSWRRVREENNRPFGYRELAEPLATYVLEMGFTHVEFLPLKEHPYGPSWGYQVSNYFAPSARYGEPDDLRYLIDYLHR